MKRGLNVLDVAKLKNGLMEGISIEEIARQCSTYPEVVQKYLDSMDQEEVATLREAAPATVQSMAELREQVKRELREELGLPPQPEEADDPSVPVDRAGRPMVDDLGNPIPVDERVDDDAAFEAAFANTQLEQSLEQEEAQGQETQADQESSETDAA